MDARKFGAFIAENRKAKNMTQAELAVKLQVTDKAVSRWERGLGFPDINTIEPLAEALNLSILELMKSEKITIGSKGISESQVIEMMDNAIEMEKENRRQERTTHCIAGVVTIIVAILVKMLSKSSIGGAIVVGGVVALAVISLYFYVKNYNDKQSRKIYGSFMLLGTLFAGMLFHVCGMDVGKMLWMVYAMFSFSVLLTY